MSEEIAPEGKCEWGGNYGLCKTHSTCELIKNELAALRKRVADLEKECDETIRMHDDVEKEMRATRKRVEEAEGKLCRARELLSKAWEYCPHCQSAPGHSHYDTTCAYCQPMKSFISSTAPCPHAAQVERLTHIVGYAIGFAIGMRRISPEWAVFHERITTMMDKAKGEGKDGT